MNLLAPNRRDFLRTSGLVLAAGGAGWAMSSGAGSVRGGSGARDRGLVAFRVGTDQWMREDRFVGLLEFFGRYPGTADELAFFTSSTHPPLPLPEIERRAARLADRLPRVRAEGMGAGINLLATMGHHEENLEASLDTPWQRVVDPHGRESRGSFCPAGEELRGYVAEVYRLLTAAGPDFIWIDDDVRLAGHMPIGFTCFCGRCLARFGDAHGRSVTRESLLALLAGGSFEERMAWRRRWLEHQRTTLDDLFRLIERTVHALRPGLPVGFMTGDRFYEGYGFERWAGTLAGPERAPVRWRPGGGFYSDESLVGLVGKAHDVGRQVSRLPATVEIIQSEIENFPYDLLRKSASATVVEAAAHMATGCTGAAFNVLSQRPDPLEEYEPILRRIQGMKPFYRILREELGRAGLVGVWPAWNPDLFAANNVDGSWPEGAGDAVSALSRCHVLGEIGLPLCYGAEGARVTVLSGPTLLAFDAARRRQIFSGGVLMDVAAWQALDRVGESAWTGVRPGEARTRDTLESLTPHAINGRFGGWSRDCRQSFWRESVYPLIPTSPGVESLARLIDYQDREWGSSMSAFTNPLGGRVVVMGYYPWSQMHHLAKSSQMKSVADWLSGSRLPIRLESFARVHLWAREPEPGRFVCFLLNASLDPLPRPALTLAAGGRRISWISVDGRRTRLRPEAVSGTPVRRVRTPTLAPWTPALLVVEA